VKREDVDRDAARRRRRARARGVPGTHRVAEQVDLLDRRSAGEDGDQLPVASGRATDDVSMARYQTTSPPASTIIDEAGGAALVARAEAVKPGSRRQHRRRERRGWETSRAGARRHVQRRPGIDAAAVGGEAATVTS